MPGCVSHVTSGDALLSTPQFSSLGKPADSYPKREDTKKRCRELMKVWFQARSQISVFPTTLWRLSKQSQDPDSSAEATFPRHRAYLPPRAPLWGQPEVLSPEQDSCGDSLRAEMPSLREIQDKLLSQASPLLTGTSSSEDTRLPGKLLLLRARGSRGTGR